MDVITPPPPIDDPEERISRLEGEVERYRISRDGWTLGVLGVAVLVLFASIIGIGLALRKSDGGGGGAAADRPVISADLSEFSIALSAAQIGVGGSIEITNSGSMEHNLGIEGTDLLSENIPSGGTATLDISDLEPGTYTVYCEIPGHAGSGMTATLVVGDDAAAAAGAADHSDHAMMTEEEAAAMDQRMIDSVLEFPAETEGRGNQVLEPTILADGTKHFELTASLVDWEVAPGQIVEAWAYNGMVPGPRINVDVGDTVEVEITNELPLGTDIHWHGIDVPNEMDGVAPLTQDLVEPGETFTYRYTTTEAGIGMYHAHAHGHTAVPNGLFGTMYVGELPSVAGTTISGIEVPADMEIALDFPMVVNDAGAIGLTLNGKSFPATEPVVVDEGDWVRVTYYNEGLQVHPMHLHGFEQLVVAKDGEPLDAPYAADTILVSPGERYTVLFHAELPGTWVWHCHILNHVESDDGMFGMVTALIVNPAE
ncbi:multicopper oxidase domain-containing protein [Desertimonas flava]|uniref:multicopper oxidase domain-containing protein n=1 Tax=Desertimonas flava TaxID=2064846 RepID=UPI000E34D736|nr:multicopper oxidase domain-containing protein [Desertimonas flava]